MVVPFDDRVVNRAHGVMETGNLRNFRYSNVLLFNVDSFNKLQNHLLRLSASAKIAGITLPLDIQSIQSTAGENQTQSKDE
jgi:branched-subunit amino acid aminotransferase/4-amino-4-deoxychorismate lyase